MDIEEIKLKVSGFTTENQITILSDLNPGKVVFTTSFGLEDQVITHMIFRNDLPVDVVTIDTGRLFPEVYKVMNETSKKYNKPIRVYFPDFREVEEMMNSKGSLSFYYSRENRLECCRIRKITPLKRAIKDKSIWISGIRASQSENRASRDWLERDENNGIIKFYPLFNWSFDDLKKFVIANQIPYNHLHDKGFVSIGCAPCTRAVLPGGDFRSGRWWWESDDKKECGFHSK